MSAWAVIALIVLVIIIVAGFFIKRYTRATLKDMDGVLDDIQIMHEYEKGKIIGMADENMDNDPIAIEVESDSGDHIE